MLSVTEKYKTAEVNNKYLNKNVTRLRMGYDIFL